MQSSAFFSFIPIFATQFIFLIDSDMKQIPRSSYLDQLNTWRDKQIIKVFTGIRRSGKSTLMQQYQQ